MICWRFTELFAIFFGKNVWHREKVTIELLTMVMEFIVLLFVILVFLYLIEVIFKPAASKPKSAADQLMDGLVALRDHLANTDVKKPKPSPKAPDLMERPSSWIVLAIFLGVLFTYIL